MRGFIRAGIVAAAALGSVAFVGAQTAGAAKASSDLGVYEAVGAPVSSMSVQFTVPKFTCTVAKTYVNGYANTFDSLNGSQYAFNGGYVQIGCNAAKEAKIYPLLEVDGVYTNETMTIKKGNVMEVGVTCGASGIDATLTDVTTGVTVSDTSSADASCASAYIGNLAVGEKNGTLYGLPTFGSWSFSDATVNGSDFGALNPTAVNYKEGSNVIKVGASSDDGSAWTNTQRS